VIDEENSLVTPNCTYQEFDLETLAPLNEETSIRKMELSNFLDEVRGKRVLDIGANAGYASILAAVNGASEVISIDVKQSYLDNIDAVANKHNLRITTRLRNFKDLDPSSERSDIVFCFEVVHWLFHQGHNEQEIFQKLADMTKETLFLETPWDVSEPSIVKKMNETMSQYDFRHIVEGLLKFGFAVEVLYFSEYFGGTSKRVMIRAQKRSD
jgi:2-polyprenyl-3-methyl-5-hydroxy-6-metoxy-1,4-benzoquinol methylase